MRRDLNRFEDNWALPVRKGSGQSRRLMTFTQFDAPRDKEQEYFKFMGRYMYLNRFQDIWALSVLERSKTSPSIMTYIPFNAP